MPAALLRVLPSLPVQNIFGFRSRRIVDSAIDLFEQGRSEIGECLEKLTAFDAQLQVPPELPGHELQNAFTIRHRNKIDSIKKVLQSHSTFLAGHSFSPIHLLPLLL